jgi:hypothetical protein
VKRVAIVASLRPGAEERARELLGQGAPFDPAQAGFRRHDVYLSANEIVFVFEGDEVEWRLDEIVSAPFQWDVTSAFDEWRKIVDGSPRIARSAYSWDADSGVSTS